MKTTELKLHFRTKEDAESWRNKFVKFKENPAPLYSSLLATTSKNVVKIDEPNEV